MKFCIQCGRPLDPAAIYCGNCGHAVENRPTPAPEPISTQNPGKSVKPSRFTLPLLLLGVAIFALLVAWFGSRHSTNTENDASSTGASSTDAPSTNAPSIKLPSSEESFISIVSAAQSQSRGVENDMQRGGVKARRDQSICSQIRSREVADWVGIVTKVDSNSDGKGVLVVEIAPGITIKTWNNALSDIGSNTLIEPGSPVFQSASAMKPGERATFSGTFLPGNSGDCVKEGSITLQGKVEEPEFIFRFSSISRYLAAQQQAISSPSDAVTTTESVAGEESAQQSARTNGPGIQTNSGTPASQNSEPAAVGEMHLTPEQLKEYYAVYSTPDVQYLRTLFDGYLHGASGHDREFKLLEQWSPDYYRSKFIVYSRNPHLAGGTEVFLIFQEKPDRVFSAWVYRTYEQTMDLRSFEPSTKITDEAMGKIRIIFKSFLEDREHAL